MCIDDLFKRIANFFQTCFIDPTKSIRIGAAFLRGSIYILFYGLFKRNVKIRFPLKAYAPLRIIGRGTVHIDKNCSIHLNVFKGLTIITLSEHAKVIIGKECSLGGLTIRCDKCVEIGDRTISAISLIQDTIFMDLNKVKMISPMCPIPEIKPTKIGKNVWLGAHCIVLSGSRIGNDSVIGAGALCYNDEIKEFCLASGNPTRRSLPIEKLLNWKE